MNVCDSKPISGPAPQTGLSYPSHNLTINGQTATFSYTAKNTGNVKENVSIAITVAGKTVATDTFTLDVGGTASRSHDITVNVPAGQTVSPKICANETLSVA